METSHDRNNIQCDICGSGFKKKTAFLKHINDIHLTKKGTLRCLVCETVQENQKLLIDHMKSMHKQKTIH